MVFLSVISVAFLTLNAHAYISPRIIGGENAPDGFFPYQASIRNSKNEHICNGVIITPSAILTSAHCVFNINLQSLSVVVDTLLLSEGGKGYPVRTVKVHERYNSFNLMNNIAIVKLESDITINTAAKAINLKRDYVGEGVLCVLSGWGFQQVSGNLSDHLQHVYLTTIESKECSKKLNKKIHDSQLCTFTKVGEGPCEKDGGSPLVAYEILIGIVSFGRPCAIGFPDVYTRISYYIDWISMNTGLDVE